MTRSWRVWVGALSVVLAVGLPAAQPAGAGAPRSVAPAGEVSIQPNIVVIMTDDQRADTIGMCVPKPPDTVADDPLTPVDEGVENMNGRCGPDDPAPDYLMPELEEQIAKQGIRFERGYVAQSVCCPSRASFLSGMNSDGSHVFFNSSPKLSGSRTEPVRCAGKAISASGTTTKAFLPCISTIDPDPKNSTGGIEKLDVDATLGPWLQQEGYTTGLIGKYLNGYVGPSPMCDVTRNYACFPTYPRCAAPETTGYIPAYDPICNDPGHRDDLVLPDGTARFPVDGVPPGWDYWNAFIATYDEPSTAQALRIPRPLARVPGGPFLNYVLFEHDLAGQDIVNRGSCDLATYVSDACPDPTSTAFIGQEAVGFISEMALRTDPFFLEVAPISPHAPSFPEPEDLGLMEHLCDLRDPQCGQPSTFNRSSRTSPTWLKSVSPISGDAGDVQRDLYCQVAGESVVSKLDCLDEFRRSQLETLRGVDQMVGDIVDTLATTQDPRQPPGTMMLENTVILYTSDNGMEWGDHKLREKTFPYEESIRVPLLMRYDAGIPPASPLRGTVDEDHLIVNIDMAPTFLDLAQAPSPPEVDGVSFADLVNGNGSLEGWRSAFKIQANGVGPSYCGIRSLDRLFVAYEKLANNNSYVDRALPTRQFRLELYAGGATAVQRRNLASSPTPGVLAELKRELVRVESEFHCLLPDGRMGSGEIGAKGPARWDFLLRSPNLPAATNGVHRKK